MKFLAILFGLVATASAINQVIYKLPEEKRIRAEKFGTPCAVEYNVDPKLLARIADGSIPRDEVHNNYLYCFATKAGFVDESGHMVIDKMTELLGAHPLLEEFKEAIKECNKVTKENPLATVVEAHRCLTTTVPIHFQL